MDFRIEGEHECGNVLKDKIKKYATQPMSCNLTVNKGLSIVVNPQQWQIPGPAAKQRLKDSLWDTSA